MKSAVVCLFLLGSSIYSFAYTSGIAIQTERSSSMQVFINGKLYNKQPNSFVRVKSQPGLFHVEVKIVNPHDKKLYVIKRDIRVEKGLEFYYKIVFRKGYKPELIEIRRYPVYSKYFLNPSLYNHHPVS